MTLAIGEVIMGIRTIVTGEQGELFNIVLGPEMGYNAMENIKYEIRGNQSKCK